MVLADKITTIINWFYIAPIKRVIPHQTFLYAACGGGNLMFNWALYAVIYNFVLQKETVHFSLIAVSAHIMAYLIVLIITFYTGFWLNKHITFTNSKLRTKVQLIRYLITYVGSIILSYIGLKFFVEFVGLYPSPSNIVTSCITVVYSYVMQTHFTFKSGD